MYCPVLKWRHRETSALAHLRAEDRLDVMPLFELPLDAWNFDTGRPMHSALAQYRDFGTRLRDVWGGARCAVDAMHDFGTGGASESMLFDSVFHQARLQGCRAQPVVTLGRSAGFLAAVKRIVQRDGFGLTLRLRRVDIEDASFALRLREVLALVCARPQQCDVLIDFEAGVAASAGALAHSICDAIDRLPNLAAWRSLAIGCTSVPASLPFDLFWPHRVLPRSEWTAYLGASELLARQGLRLSYADYGVHHPNAEMVDPRLVGRDLALVYATNESWLVFVSEEVEALGIRDIARQWRAHPYHRRREAFVGPWCWADQQIARLCSAEITPADLDLWPQVATNRHLVIASRQLRLAQWRMASPWDELASGVAHNRSAPA